MSTNFVEELLQKASENDEINQKSVTVNKQIELNFDLGHILAFDSNHINSNYFRTNKELCLKELTRDNTQLIINKLWELQTKTVDNTVVAQLPKPHYLLPRSKALPKPKTPTKWETYAKEKGINKTKKDKLVWDESNKEWKPRFGFKGINQNSNQWMIEVPNNADPNVDYFEKKKDEKKERIAKNELQRLRNIARSHKMRLPGTAGIVPHLSQSKEQLQKASMFAKHSTASVGKFTESLPKEKPPKNMGKKRQFEPNLGNMNTEKDRNLKIITEIMNKKPKFDINKAVDPLVPNKKPNIKKSRVDLKGKKGKPAIRTKNNKFKSDNRSKSDDGFKSNNRFKSDNRSKSDNRFNKTDNKSNKFSKSNNKKSSLRSDNRKK